MSEWREVRLGDVVELQRGFDLPTQARRPGRVPIVSSSGISGSHDEARVKGPGVVTGRYGTLGQVFYITQPFWPLNTTLFARDFKGNDPHFVSYLLKTVDFLAYSDKAAVPGINRNHLHEAIVRVPPVADQRRIAGILGALDDKIELNRRLAETLQTTARTLFDSWFRAGSRTEADGWRHSVIGKEFEVTMGQSPPGSTYNSTGDGLPFYQGRADFGARFPARRVYCTAPTRTAAAGDTLLSVRAPVGDINIATETCAIGRGVAAIRHHSGSRTFSFEFMGAMRGVLDEYNGHGTVFGAIGGKDLSAMPCLAPPDGLVRRFDEQARPLDERMENLERQRQTLTEVRDAMLPRLLNGEMSSSIGRGQGA